MRYLGGHLGAVVSPLLDGQLDPSSAERAWSHVHGCEACRRHVEREGWVKTRLSAMTRDEGAPPQALLGSLYGLGSADDAADAWAAVAEIERRGRDRRRTGIALVGAGSVSAAVLGLATLTGSTLGIGGAPGPTPTTATARTGVVSPSSTATGMVAPVMRVHGRLPAAARPGQSAGQSADPAPRR